MSTPPTAGDRPSAPLSILVVDDEESMRHFLTKGLRRLGYGVEVASSGEAAMAQLTQRAFDVALFDVRMPGMDGLSLLARARALQPDLTVLLMTAHGSVATAVDAMKLGAADFVLKPFELDEVQLRLDRAIELRAALRENRDLRRRLQQPAVPGLVAHSAAMRALLGEMELLRQSEATVLLTGESGTGKGLLARTLHTQSARSGGPFVVANLPAVPETLFESTMFGHEAGAFTGAVQQKQGLVARAAGGTLLLDEIGELSLSAQAKIERLLQEREFTPVGSSRSERADVRIVAATNKDLAAATQAGTFRSELRWRLEVVHLRVPPLRQRREDVPMLVVQRLSLLAQRDDKPAKTVTAEALAAMAAYDWPGNVRELENLTERMAVLAGERSVLGTGDLPPEVRGLSPLGDVAGDYEQARRHFDQAYFSALLVRCAGSISEAARQCGISRGHLHRRLRELGIETKSARQLDAPNEDDET